MQIIINNDNQILDELASQKTETRIASAFSKFGYNVESVELTTRDVSGPRGGVDKECRVVVSLRKMEDVAAATIDASLPRAISRSINRAERAVARKIELRSFRDADRRSDFGFAFYNN
jgi:putative sigma-54 modulation protein